MNDTVIDARGLSCPQPVMLTLDGLDKIKNGQIVVLVDTDTSRENVIRAAKSRDWTVKEIQPEGIGFKIVLVKD